MIDVGDTVALIGAIAGALGTIGGGIKFVWGKVERRFQQIEGQLLECRVRERMSERRSAVKLTVIELLWQQVEHFDQGSPVLTRAKKLLDDLKLMQAFPVESLPDEFRDLAQRLTEGDEA